MDLQNITLISLGYFENEFLRKISDAVSGQLKLPVIIREANLDLIEFYDAGRRQYNGNTILQEIDKLFGSDKSKTIALLNVDLFIPILTFIFGQAYLNGRTAIASIYRLGNEPYGLERDDEILADRFIKEVIHELGHTLGLKHCHIQTCVMRSVTYIEEIDQKMHALCPSCRKQTGL
ncbi:MAG TPA: archaemetzincin family Zn-dependent metalloprotease [Bacteroidales bacterium]|nr:archaemetzincin family Zn-dependent metalloprotease [Bacteroidales bacterium]